MQRVREKTLVENADGFIEDNVGCRGETSVRMVARPARLGPSGSTVEVSLTASTNAVGEKSIGGYLSTEELRALRDGLDHLLERSDEP